MPRDDCGDIQNTALSVAAHAAMFDQVAGMRRRRHTETPLDARRQVPSRRESFAFFDRWLAARELDRRDVLDLGCGCGEVSVQIALAGARVTGVDISPESLARARALAAHHGVAERIAFEQARAENLPFGDDSFELAVAAGLMSFVDFDRTIAELARVVRRDGQVVVQDTLGHHPVARLGRLIKLLRGRTTAHQVENIPTCGHIDRIRAHFGAVEVHCFDVLTVPLIAIENALRRVHPALPRALWPLSIAARMLDRALMRWRPMRRWAFRIVVILKYPRDGAPPSAAAG